MSDYHQLKEMAEDYLSGKDNRVVFADKLASEAIRNEGFAWHLASAIAAYYRPTEETE